MVDDKELLRLQDMLDADITNMLRSSRNGQTCLNNDDVKLLYEVVVQARETARLERERFAKWMREAAKFHAKRVTELPQTNPENFRDVKNFELDMAHAYNKVAHMLEENYMPELW